jgi:hypothetical protein
MKTLTALKAKAEQARGSHAYRAEGASIRFTEDLVALMKTSGLTRTALAEKSAHLLPTLPKSCAAIPI